MLGTDAEKPEQGERPMQGGQEDQTTREGAIGAGAITSRFATLLIRDVDGSRLARVRIPSDHYIKGNMMTRSMQSGDVRLAESTICEKNILFDSGVVLGFAQDAAPNLG